MQATADGFDVSVDVPTTFPSPDQKWRAVGAAGAIGISSFDIAAGVTLDTELAPTGNARGSVRVVGGLTCLPWRIGPGTQLTVTSALSGDVSVARISCTAAYFMEIDFPAVIRAWVLIGGQPYQLVVTGRVAGFFHFSGDPIPEGAASVVLTRRQPLGIDERLFAVDGGTNAVDGITNFDGAHVDIDVSLPGATASTQDQAVTISGTLVCP